jgi:hypothetical protein
VECISRGGVEPTHYPGSKGEGAVDPVFRVIILFLFTQNRLTS